MRYVHAPVALAVFLPVTRRREADSDGEPDVPILLLQASHFTVNGETKDYAYGQPNSMTLAQSNPEEAVMNADGHEYFAENNPPQE